MYPSPNSWFPGSLVDIQFNIINQNKIDLRSPTLPSFYLCSNCQYCTANIVCVVLSGILLRTLSLPLLYWGGGGRGDCHQYPHYGAFSNLHFVLRFQIFNTVTRVHLAHYLFWLNIRYRNKQFTTID